MAAVTCSKPALERGGQRLAIVMATHCPRCHHYGNTLLSIACQNGLKRAAKLVLRRGADINAQNHKGNTPLHFCYTYGYGDTLGAYLTSKGADTTVRNHDGMTCYDQQQY